MQEVPEFPLISITTSVDQGETQQPCQITSEHEGSLLGDRCCLIRWFIQCGNTGTLHTKDLNSKSNMLSGLLGADPLSENRH